MLRLAVTVLRVVATARVFLLPWNIIRRRRRRHANNHLLIAAPSEEHSLEEPCITFPNSTNSDVGTEAFVQPSSPKAHSSSEHVQHENEPSLFIDTNVSEEGITLKDVSVAFDLVSPLPIPELELEEEEEEEEENDLMEKESQQPLSVPPPFPSSHEDVLCTSPQVSSPVTPNVLSSTSPNTHLLTCDSFAIAAKADEVVHHNVKSSPLPTSPVSETHGDCIFEKTVPPSLLPRRAPHSSSALRRSRASFLTRRTSLCTTPSSNVACSIPSSIPIRASSSLHASRWAAGAVKQNGGVASVTRHGARRTRMSPTGGDEWSVESAHDDGLSCCSETSSGFPSSNTPSVATRRNPYTERRCWRVHDIPRLPRTSEEEDRVALETDIADGKSVHEIIWERQAAVRRDEHRRRRAMSGMHSAGGRGAKGSSSSSSSSSSSNARWVDKRKVAILAAWGVWDDDEQSLRVECNGDRGCPVDANGRKRWQGTRHGR